MHVLATVATWATLASADWASTTVANRSAGEQLASQLEARLHPQNYSLESTHLEDIRSFFWWDGALQEEDEVRATIDSDVPFSVLLEGLSADHPYDLPMIVSSAHLDSQEDHSSHKHAMALALVNGTTMEVAHGLAKSIVETLAWKPGKRPLLEPGLLLIEKPEGLGKVEQPLPKVYAMAEKRHVRQVESKLEHQDRPQEKRTVYRENRIRAADQPAKEVDITTEMTRKARVEDMMTRRNLIDCNCLGDKYYRHPEYMPGFYKAGGLITGSSFHRGMYKKTVPRNSMSMLLLSEGEKRISKSYQEKQAEREVLEAQFEVKALTKSWEHQTLKECDKTFEPADSEDDAPEAGA